MNKNKKLKTFLYHVINVLIAFVFIFPIYYIIITSFKTEREIGTNVSIWLSQPIVTNYYEAFTKYNIGPALYSSMVVAIFATIIGVIIGSMSAYVINRYDQKKLAFTILTTMMIPYVVCAIPLFILFQKIGWFDTYSGLILSHLIITVPQSVWILVGFVKAIPKEIEEAALVDGCTKFGLFYKIVFPLLKGGIVAAATLGFIMSWNNFSLALMLGGSKTVPAPLALFNFVGEAAINWGGLAASATLMLIPTIVFTLWVQKHLTQGLMVGAIQ